MASIIVKILVSIGTKLVTETVIKEVALILLGKLVVSTKNDLDDKLLNTIKDALK
jgi:RNA-binding protein YhbY